MSAERLAKSIKEKGDVVDAAWGAEPQMAPDVFDSAFGEILPNLARSEERPASSFQGRMRQAVSRAAVQAAEVEREAAAKPVAEKVTPEKREDAQFLSEHLDFIVDLHDRGQMTDEDFAQEWESTETELLNLSQEN